MADTVRLELEYGDVEFEFEGPADFARTDLLPLLEGIISRLADLDTVEIEEIGEDDDEDDEDDDEEEMTKPGH